MLYQLVEYYTKDPNKIIYTSELATYRSNKPSFMIPSPKQGYYWFKTIENFGYLYDKDKKLIDHYTRKPGTNIYKPHKAFAGGELVLTDNGRYVIETYGSGIPVIGCSTGLVHAINKKEEYNFKYNWEVPKNDCLVCLKMNPPGPFSSPQYEKMYDHLGNIIGTKLK